MNSLLVFNTILAVDDSIKILQKALKYAMKEVFKSVQLRKKQVKIAYWEIAASTNRRATKKYLNMVDRLPAPPPLNAFYTGGIGPTPFCSHCYITCQSSERTGEIERVRLFVKQEPILERAP